MTIISLAWGKTILVLGIMNVLTGLTCRALWLLVSQKQFVRQVPERFVSA